MNRQNQSSLNRVSRGDEAPTSRAAKCTEGLSAAAPIAPANESQADIGGDVTQNARPIPAPYPKATARRPRRPGRAPDVSPGYKVAGGAVCLVRRSVCSDRAQLEPIERDWNAQTLARSRVWMREASCAA